MTREERWHGNLANVVRVLRMLHGLNIRQQAKQWGVSSATICRIENGKGCDLATLSKISEATGMKVESLLEGVKPL